MLFNSHLFLLIFLPLVLATFYLAPKKFRLPVLMVASLAFYAESGLVPLVIMIISVTWAYITAFMLRTKRSGLALAFAIAIPALLFYLFRYLDFTLNTLNASPTMREPFFFFLTTLVPAGISFYTFHIISYSVDVSERKVKSERDFVELLTFFSFFPHLIAGPILRYPNLKPQLDQLKLADKIDHDFVTGIKFLSYGLLAKVFFADFLSKPQGRFSVTEHHSAIDALFSVLAYSFRIYYDFWAYSLMAIGLGLMFGIRLPKNFDEPYLSLNPKEFWRRWHMTLSFWIRDYLYLRLGGNKSYVRNIFIAFLLCGLWHGAGWNFVIWGASHGVLVVVYHLIRPWWDRAPIVLQIGVTFSIVTLLWPLFYLDFEHWLMLLNTIFISGHWSSEIYGKGHWLMLGLIAAWTFLMRERWWLYNTAPKPFDWGSLQAGLVFASILFFSWSETFIYFRF